MKWQVQKWVIQWTYKEEFGCYKINSWDENYKGQCHLETFTRIVCEEGVEQVHDNVKWISTPLTSDFKLSNEQPPSTKQEWNYIVKMPYAYFIESYVCHSVIEASKEIIWL